MSLKGLALACSKYECSGYPCPLWVTCLLQVHFFSGLPLFRANFPLLLFHHISLNISIPILSHFYSHVRYAHISSSVFIHNYPQPIHIACLSVVISTAHFFISCVMVLNMFAQWCLMVVSILRSIHRCWPTIVL